MNIYNVNNIIFNNTICLNHSFKHCFMLFINKQVNKYFAFQYVNYLTIFQNYIKS